MTPLRQRMIEDVQVRNQSANTRRHTFKEPAPGGNNRLLSVDCRLQGLQGVSTLPH
jgi:hypothetical protein